MNGKIIKFDWPKSQSYIIDKHDSSEDPNQYISVELSKSGAIVNVKRKRLVKEELWNRLGYKREADDKEL